MAKSMGTTSKLKKHGLKWLKMTSDPDPNDQVTQSVKFHHNDNVDVNQSINHINITYDSIKVCR